MKDKRRLRPSSALAAILLVLSFSVPAENSPSAGFSQHATVSGIGKALNVLVAKGPVGGSRELYISRAGNGGKFDIVATDPSTGNTNVFESPLAKESSAWAMVEGRDGQIYIGTTPHAHIMRLDWKQRRLVDLGTPSATEKYIWQLALGSDGLLYGGTFPHAKLIRFDPTTGESADLGRMSESQQYARYVVADDSGFVYIGIGMAEGDLVAYDISTGQHRSILPADKRGMKVVQVIRGADGKAYAKLDKWMKLSGWTMKPNTGPPPKAPLRLKNKSTVSFSDSDVTVTTPSGNVNERPMNYKGKAQTIFRIALGPDSKIYGSTAAPAHFFWADTKGKGWGEIADAGAGEFYSFVSWKNRLFGAAYSAKAPIFSYQPGKPWVPGDTAESSPRWIHYRGENAGWRPSAMVVGQLGKIYIGATPGYGLLGGLLCVLNPETGEVNQYPNVVANQSVHALALLPNGLLVGGTSVAGGGGSVPTEKDAKLFLWDPKTRRKTFEVAPAPGQGTVDALAVSKSGVVYGFAGPVMFAFDPLKRRLISIGRPSIGRVIYGALGAGPRGVLYGLTSKGIFRINDGNHKVELLVTYPGGITGGFAIDGKDIYFTQGPKLLSYRLPN